MKPDFRETDYHFSASLNTTAPPEKIWQIWTDTKTWHVWDTGLKNVILNGKFSKGTEGVIIPDNGPKSKFIITQITEHKTYTFKTKIPMGWLVITRALYATNGKTQFMHQVEFTGPLKKVLGLFIGKKYRQMLPQVLTNIKQLAEK